MATSLKDSFLRIGFFSRGEEKPWQALGSCKQPQRCLFVEHQFAS
jgi:hypothetical protein